MKNIAIILAGGAGKRFGGDRPKQLMPLEDGRSVLEHAVEAFRECECIDEVIVVMHRDWIEDLLLSPLKGEGVRFVPGGRERWESSWNGIVVAGGSSGSGGSSSSSDTSSSSSSSDTSGSSSSSDTSDSGLFDVVNVLIHDAARPFVSRRIIEDVCKALETHEAVTVAVPATDTMYSLSPAAMRHPESRSALAPRQPSLFGVPSQGTPPSKRERGKNVSEIADSGRYVAEIPDRATMMRAQTPQGFRLSVIKKAYEIAVKDPDLQATDDCGIVHKYMPEVPIYIVEGEEANRKITFKEDLR